MFIFLGGWVVHTVGIVVVSICGRTVLLRTVLSEHLAAFDNGSILDLQTACHPRFVLIQFITSLCIGEVLKLVHPLHTRLGFQGVLFDGNEATYPSIAHQKLYLPLTPLFLLLMTGKLLLPVYVI